MTCRSGCPTQDHATYGECLRLSGTRVAYTNSANGWDYTKQKRWDKELAGYRAAVAEGLNPPSSYWGGIDKARRAADQAGTAVEV